MNEIALRSILKISCKWTCRDIAFCHGRTCHYWRPSVSVSCRISPSGMYCSPRGSDELGYELRHLQQPGWSSGPWSSSTSHEWNKMIKRWMLLSSHSPDGLALGSLTEWRRRSLGSCLCATIWLGIESTNESINTIQSSFRSEGELHSGSFVGYWRKSPCSCRHKYECKEVLE